MDISVFDGIGWSFDNEVAASPEDLIAEIERTENELFSEGGLDSSERYDASRLRQDTGLSELVARFTFPVVGKDGSKQEGEFLLHITGASGRLTYANVLWHLHHHAHNHAVVPGHRFFEGLRPSAKSTAAIPVFDVIMEG